jgi:superfamily II DNA or RNA helicase
MKKGYLYEVQIRDYIINSLNKPAYLWSDTPETILIDCGIIKSHNHNRKFRKENKINPVMDTGIDVIQVDDETICSFVQCKNGYKKGLRVEDLAGFMCWMAMLDKMNGYVYYTNKLSKVLLDYPSNPRVQYIKHQFIEDNKNENINKFIIDNEKLEYQNEINVAFTEHFKKNNRGILSLPCGTGKTFASFLVSKKYKQIIIISPLKQFAKQNLDRYVEYGFTGKTLLVNSDNDGNRDINEIKKIIKENKNLLISATFCSVDVIQECLLHFNNALFIVDEFHNLSKANVSDKDNHFYKLLNSDAKIMFMSATPRIYELEDDSTNIGDIEVMLGPVVYKMNFTKAIEKKYITDYRIWLPSIHEDNNKLEKKLSIYEIDNVIKSKCIYLFACLLNNGSKKCIIYCKNTKEIDSMKVAMTTMNQFYYLDIGVSKITCEDSEKIRLKVLQDFANSTKIELLFSVRILDECIDIPLCDSIYITYPSQSKIRTIQRLSRCIRTNKNNKFKIGNIYIWCDEYDKILQTLGGIKEYDINFKEKIKIVQNNFNGERKPSDYIDDKKLVDKYVITIKEYRQENWVEMLENTKKFIDENNKRPQESKDDIEQISLKWWVSHQIDHYKKGNLTGIRKELWENFINDEKYKKYFIDNNIIDNNIWKDGFEKLIKYIDDNDKLPTKKTDKYLANWLYHQTQFYKNKVGRLSNEENYDKWTNFINDDKYKVYFMDSVTEWYYKLKLVEDYIKVNNKRPSAMDKNKIIKAQGKWIQTQKVNYRDKTQSMTNETIYNDWNKFINKYNNYIGGETEIWENNLILVKKYIDENNKRPSKSSVDSQVKKLGEWIVTQGQNYRIKKKSMLDKNICTLWENFINDLKYKKYF